MTTMLGEKSSSEDVRSLSVSVSLKRNQTENLELQFISTCDVIFEMPGLVVYDVTKHGKISQLIPTFPKIEIFQKHCNCLRRNRLKAGF